jgi:hypothetical protein
MKSKGATIFACFLLGIPLLFAFESLGYRGMARMVPLVLSIPTAILAAIVLCGERFPALIRYFEIGLEDILVRTGVEENEPPLPVSKPGEMKTIVQIFSWFLTFAVLLIFTGFYISAAVFTLLFTRFHARTGWPGAVFLTVLAEVFFYVVFEWALNVDLFKGIFFGSLVPPL